MLTTAVLNRVRWDRRQKEVKFADFMPDYAGDGRKQDPVEVAARYKQYALSKRKLSK